MPLRRIHDGVCPEHAREILAAIGLSLERRENVAKPVLIAAEQERRAA